MVVDLKNPGRMRWRGVEANYSRDEKRLLEQLRQAGAGKDELWFIHLAKSLLDATIHDR